MKAFIGRDFDEKYDSLIQKIVEHIEAHDIKCIGAKKARSKSIDEKITDLILECEIFVGVFTCDKPICQKEKIAWFCKPRKIKEYSTSNWVIQESGFAIGSNRGLVLLVEDGVRGFPKLQGNIDYIPFKRNSIEESFTKLSEIINDVKTKITGGAAEPPTKESEQPDSTKPEEQERQPKEGMKTEKDKVLKKVFEALFKDKDYSKAQRIFDEKAEVAFDDDDRAPLRAYVLRESHSLGDKSAFEKLRKLVQENEDNPRVIKQLGYHYKERGEFEKATEIFLSAKDKYHDISDTDKKKGLIDAYIQAAWCFSLDEKYNDAINTLNDPLFDTNLEEQKAEILEAMARISKENGKIESFFAHGEAALNINPHNAKLRFDLAYAYSDNNNEKLGLLHYKKLTDDIKNHSAGLNNLGASYGRLNLIGKSVQSYIKAADYDSSWGMGNLAHKYLDAGFIIDAKRMIDKANKLYANGVEVSPRVANAREKLDDMHKKEAEKEKEILSEARKESQYRVRHSKALCPDMNITKDGIDGMWETPWGNGKLNYDESTKSFNIRTQKETDQSFLSSLLAAKVGIPISEPEKKFQNISIEGTFEGLGGKYNIRIIEGKEAPTLLTGEADATGHLILNDDLNNMSVMEKTKDGKIEFKQWKKQPTPSGPS